MKTDEFNDIETQGQESTLSIDDFLEIGLRRKWYIIIPFTLAIAIAFIYTLLLPKTYRATATIVVSQQILSNDYLKSPLATQPGAYMTVIEEEIRSRTFLEQIINELGLFPDLVGTVPMEILVDWMRESTELTVSQDRDRSRQGITSFSVSYVGEDPETITSVTNRIVSLLIEKQFATRGKQADKATTFIADELESTKIALAKEEKLLTEFKKQYQKHLPEQKDSNLRILENLITQLQKITEQLDSAKNRKSLLQQQLVQSEAIPFLTGEQDRSTALLSPLQGRYARMTDQLIELQSKYSDRHPEVINTKAEIEKLQQLIAKEDTGEKTTETFVNPLSHQINQQLLAVNLEIERFTREEKSIGEMITEYQMRIEQSPQTEQQLATLADNYEHTRQAYEALLQKKLEAEQSEKLENKYQEEQFKILDPARVPEIPFKPNKRRLLLIGFMLAVIAGLGTAFLAESMDHSFHRIKDVESYLELPVILSIPSMEIPAKE